MSHELQKIPSKKCLQNFVNHILGRSVIKLDDTLERIIKTSRLIMETKVGWNWFAIFPLGVSALEEKRGFQQQTVGITEYSELSILYDFEV